MTPNSSDITAALKWMRMPYRKQMESVGGNSTTYSLTDLKHRETIKQAREFYRLLKAAEECEL